MDWFPIAKGSQEVLALGCSDGSFKLISKAGRVEKSVAEAHQTAIISIKWSYEGAALATAGEDGNKTIYGVCWNPENDSLLYCSEKNLTIIPTLPGVK